MSNEKYCRKCEKSVDDYDLGAFDGLCEECWNEKNEEDSSEETYGEFLERTGLEDTQQRYEMFMFGYDEDDM